MKNLRLILTAVVVVWASAASAQGTYSFGGTPSLTIPDANASGVTIATNLTGMTGSISNISLSLNISNAAGSTAYNGDLYAYLVGPNGGFAVLLNRTGVGTGNAFGYNNQGFNVTFDLFSANSIHFYQNFGPPIIGGQVTGNWLPDGRAIDPQSSPSAFDAGGAADLSTFVNTDPNGTWYLYFADLAGGNTASVQSWTLNIQTVLVPEPSTWVLMILAGVAVVRYGGIFRRRA
jgi:subtilisin-like proprotein convertase family protein